MELQLYKIDGTQTGTPVNLPESVFNIEPNDHVIYQAVRTQLSNSRQGTFGSKTRSEVRGGGKKPWRQKGRGTARAGSSRSSVWVGGARIFGPKAHEFNLKITKKMKKLARRSAFTYKARKNEIVVVEDFNLENPKTREMFAILKNLKVVGQKVLLLVPEVVASKDNKILRAGRNIPNFQIRTVMEVSTYDIMNCNVLLIQKSSMEKLEAVL